MVREIPIEWTTVNGGGKVSVLYFQDAPAPAVQRSALDAFCQSLCAAISTTCSYNIPQTGREFNTASGTLTGAWIDALAYTDSGINGTADVLPDATQALLQWTTSEIANGRFVRGRTSIPGVTEQSSALGNPTPALISAFGAAAQALVDAQVGLSIWHRPTASTGGSLHTVTAGVCWDEFAVLRRRRG